jgi:methylamine dehydrogenase accessory protein MauD
VIGTLLPFGELVAGVALVFVPTARWGALLAFVLLAGFIVGIARALARGEQPDCHCFGQIHSAPAGRLTLARNVVLAAFAGVIVGYGSGPAVDAWVSARSAAVLVAIGTSICGIAAAIYAAKLRTEVERFKNDLRVARKSALVGGRFGLPVGIEAPPFSLPDLKGGTTELGDLLGLGRPTLLVFMSPWCGPCADLMPRIRQWQETLSERLTIAIVSTGTAKQHASFEEHGLENVLLQEQTELAELYHVTATPSAVLVSVEGRIASSRGDTEQGIEPLVRLAIRQGGAVPVESSAA